MGDKKFEGGKLERREYSPESMATVLRVGHTVTGPAAVILSFIEPATGKEMFAVPLPVTEAHKIARLILDSVIQAVAARG